LNTWQYFYKPVLILVAVLFLGSIHPGPKPDTEYIGSFEKEFHHYVRPYQDLIDPDLLKAQISVETWHGEKILLVRTNGKRVNSKNLFNIKAYPPYPGKKGTAYVHEYIGTNIVWMHEDFRIYDTYHDAVAGYIRMVSDPEGRYQSAWELRDWPELYLEELHRKGYGTHPHYVDAVMRRYRKIKAGGYPDGWFTDE
jgi:flagellum-specific peptidoglycan hydrolase FlgJ